YFTSVFLIPDTLGLEPLTADLDLVPGIPLRGRVTDRATGKPVRGAAVSYHALQPNPHVRTLPEHNRARAEATTGEDGSFAVAALPGPGVVAVAAPDVGAYTPALVTTQELKDFFKDGQPRGSDRELNEAVGVAGWSPLFQANYNALVLLNP